MTNKTRQLVIILIVIAIANIYNVKANNFQFIDNDSITINQNDTASFILVEKNAQFKNGNVNDFRLYIQANIKYSNSLVKNNRIVAIIQFVIDKSGKTCNFKVIQSCGIADLDIEAIRAIKESPNWTPATIADKNVNQRITIPVVFESKK